MIFQAGQGSNSAIVWIRLESKRLPRVSERDSSTITCDPAAGISLWARETSPENVTNVNQVYGFLTGSLAFCCSFFLSTCCCFCLLALFLSFLPPLSPIGSLQLMVY